jgi:hypothetical protein
MFVQRGGARLDTFNVTWPLAKLSVRDDALVLDVLSTRYEFPRGDVAALRRYRGIASVGLMIEHTLVDPTVPRRVVFWTFNFAALEGVLVKEGYAVLGREHEVKWWRDLPWRRPRQG